MESFSTMKKDKSNQKLETLSKKISKGMRLSAKRLIEQKRQTGGKLIIQRNGQIETISFGIKQSHQ